MPLIPIQREGTQPPLFVAPQLATSGRLAWVISNGLGADHPVYTFDRPRREDGEYLNDLDAMAEIHADELEQAGFDGPFHLAGYSFGAQLAYVLAGHLLRRGREIALLAVIDDNADLDRRRFGIENVSRDFTNDEIAGRYAIDRVARRKFPGKVTLFRADRWIGEYQNDPGNEWHFLAEGGVDVLDFPATHAEIVTARYRHLWIDPLKKVMSGRRDEAGLRHIPPRTDRAPETALTAFARAKHGDLQGEIRGYQMALEQRPDAADWIRINLAAALEQAGETEAAIAVLMAAADRAERVSNIHVTLARLLQRSGRGARVRELAQSALKLDAATPSDLQLRGIFFRICGMTGESQKAHLKALELEPSRFRCRVPAARAMLAGGQLEALGKLLRDGLDIDPDLPPLLELQAEYLIATGDPGTAEEILNRLIARNGKLWNAHVVRLNLVNGQGRLEDAMQLAEALLALDPPHAPALEAIARIHLSAGRIDSATKLFRKAMRRNENFLPAWIGLSRALEKAGQHAQAADLLQGMPRHLRDRPVVKSRAAEIAQKAGLQELETPGGE